MSAEKWKREMQAKQDGHQAKWTETGKLTQKIITKAEITTITEPVSCPFCLHIGKIGEFLISTKKGYHKSLGLCPECKNKMQLRSLTAEWTPEQYAEWCFSYSLSGFWQKVPFKKWSDRLYKIGWSYAFWNKYKQLKGESTEDKTESYQDYIMRRQREEYEAEQRGEE